MNIKVISIQPQYERILSYLFPTYSVRDVQGFASDSFIVRRNIESVAERDRLGFTCSNCVILSDRVFDEVWDEKEIINQVLLFARTNFGSRKRVLRTTSVEGDALIDELISFLFLEQVSEDDEVRFKGMFESFGSWRFFEQFLTQCADTSLAHASSAMDTFLLKVVQGVDSLFYRKARSRFGRGIRDNVVLEAFELDNTLPLWKKYFRELCKLRTYSLLAKNNYYD